MKHESNFVTERVVFGLFSLLFILSAAQVAAILDMSPAQPAQVVKAEKGLNPALFADNDCVSFVSHKYNEIFSNPFDLPSSNDGTDLDYRYEVYFDIKNNCSRPISLIDPASLSTPYKNQPGFYSVSSFALEQNALPSPIDVPLDPPSNIINAAREEGGCVSCGTGSMVFRASPLGTIYQGGVQGVRAYEIPVGQTRTLSFNLQIGRTSPTNGFIMMWRAKLKSFKWTYASSHLSGGIVSADEIFTKNLSQTEQNMVATDFVTIYQDANMNSCPAGSSLGFNSSGSVVCQ